MASLPHACGMQRAAMDEGDTRRHPLYSSCSRAADYRLKEAQKVYVFCCCKPARSVVRDGTGQWLSYLAVQGRAFCRPAAWRMMYRVDCQRTDSPALFLSQGPAGSAAHD